MSKVVSEISAERGAESLLAEPVLSAKSDVGVVSKMRAPNDSTDNSAPRCGNSCFDRPPVGLGVMTDVGMYGAGKPST
jgi:hypothetical protein